MVVRAGTLDEEAKTELRENKMRLDREFGSMLIKIAVRVCVCTCVCVCVFVWV